MVNQQLIDYIKQQLSQNIDREQIKSSLIANGWEASDIEEGFNSITVGIQNNPIISVPKSSNSFVKIITGLSGVVVLAVLGWFTYGYFYNSKINNQTEVPAVSQETSQETNQMSPIQNPLSQNNPVSADCGTINWNTYLKVSGFIKNPLTEAEKTAVTCVDKALLNCSSVILREDNNQIDKPAGAFNTNNYKILGLEGDFCKVSTEIVDTKTQNTKTGICKVPTSDIAKIPKDRLGYSFMIFLPVGTSVLHNKAEQKTWECSFN